MKTSIEKLLISFIVMLLIYEMQSLAEADDKASFQIQNLPSTE